MFAVSAFHCGPFSLAGILDFILFEAAGIFVMLGMELIMTAVSFKWIGNSRIPEIFDSVKQFAKYPMTVFPSAARVIIAFAVPVAMISFLPASVLFGRAEPWYYLTLVPCALFSSFGFFLYHKMIRLYESAGG